MCIFGCPVFSKLSPWFSRNRPRCKKSTVQFPYATHSCSCSEQDAWDDVSVLSLCCRKGGCHFPNIVAQRGKAFFRDAAHAARACVVLTSYNQTDAGFPRPRKAGCKVSFKTLATVWHRNLRIRLVFGESILAVLLNPRYWGGGLLGCPRSPLVLVCRWSWSIVLVIVLVMVVVVLYQCLGI